MGSKIVRKVAISSFVRLPSSLYLLHVHDDTPSFYVAVSLVYVQTKHGLLSTFGALPRCLLVQQALRCDGALLYTTSLAMIKVCTEEECSVVNPQDE